MRRLFRFLFSIVLALSLTACQQTVSPPSSQQGQRESTAESSSPVPEKLSAPAPVQSVSGPVVSSQPESDSSEEPSSQQEENPMSTARKFNFVTKTVLLNSGYEMPINGLAE